MAETPEFEKWWKVECARVTGKLQQVAEHVEQLMKPHNITVEVKQDGKWVKWDWSDEAPCDGSSANTSQLQETD